MWGLHNGPQHIARTSWFSSSLPLPGCLNLGDPAFSHPVWAPESKWNSPSSPKVLWLC